MGRMNRFIRCLFLEDVGNEFIQAATPGEPLVGGARGLVVRRVDADVVQVLHERIRAEILLGAHAHEQVMDLLVELVGIREGAVVESLEIGARHIEDGATEGAHPRELVSPRRFVVPSREPFDKSGEPKVTVFKTLYLFFIVSSAATC